LSAHTRLDWREGERRLRELERPRQERCERVVERIVAELRRRLGSRFTTSELLELYSGSTAWTMALAVSVEPGEPLAWEQWVADAAFGRYARGAADWQGS
jgi:hypothetical protein